MFFIDSWDKGYMVMVKLANATVSVYYLMRLNKLLTER